MTGSAQPCFDQTEKIFGIPLPALSPMLIRLNIFSSALLRGSDMPPLFAASISIRNPPGLEKVICSFLLMITTPYRP